MESPEYYLIESLKFYTRWVSLGNTIKREKILELSNKFTSGENLTIARYNDGEWAYMLRIQPELEASIRKRKHDRNKILNEANKLLEIIKSEPNYYISVDHVSLTHSRFKGKVTPYFNKMKKPLKGGIFNMWSFVTGFEDLFSEFRRRKVLMVGPPSMKNLPIIADLIPVPQEHVAYQTERLVQEMEEWMDNNFQENMVIIYSCAFTAKVALHHFHQKYGDRISQFDMGAAIAPFIGRHDRPWHHAVSGELKKKPPTKMKLSILKNAGPGTITYYVGDNTEHVLHLSNCVLICKHGFNCGNDSVEHRHVDNPQLEFYQLSKEHKKDYLPAGQLKFNDKNKSYIHPAATIGKNVKIGIGCVIGKVVISDDVEIGSNVNIHSETFIGKGSIIESGTVIGSGGMMWVWNGTEKVYLEQLGGVHIGENCRIGSLIEIVRGSANETTVIGNNVTMAHGTLIGHGCYVGDNSHFANGVKLGGSCYVAPFSFLGSGSMLSANYKILAENVILGTGAVVVKNIEESGVYVGNPAKKIKETEGKMSGVPTWYL